MKLTINLVALALLWTAVAAPAQNIHSEEESALITLLLSDEAPAKKAIACKKLTLFGTKKSVPALAALLADPELASWARIPLEAIPDPEVDAALRAAVPKLKGRLLIGVLNSIGVRKDAEATPVLKGLLTDGDTGVASAAAVALGHIGTDAAAEGLVAVLPVAPAGVRDAVAEGCILSGEQRLAEGDGEKALRYYQAVRDAKISRQKTREAVRGIVLARGDAGIPTLAELLGSADRHEFSLGLHLAREISGPKVAEILVETRTSAPANRKNALLLALSERGDAEALPIALNMAGAGEAANRIFAIDILSELRDPAAVKVFLQAAGDPDPKVVEAARKALARLPGAETDQALKAMLKDQEPATRLLAIELLTQRRAEGIVDALIGAAGDSDPSVRLAALKSLSVMAGEEDVHALLRLMLAGRTGKELAIAENTVATVCMRNARMESGRLTITKAVYGDLPDGKQADVTLKVMKLVKEGSLEIPASNKVFGDPAGGTVKQLRIDYKMAGKIHSKQVKEDETLTLTVTSASAGCVQAVLASLRSASGESKQALLRILKTFGGKGALDAMRLAAKDADEGVRETAMRALFDWPDEYAIPDLAMLSRMAPRASFKILALRGYIRLVQDSNKPPAEKLMLLKDAAGLTTRPEEVRLVLAALGTVPSDESLAMVLPYLEQDGLKDEAAAAVVAIAEKASPRTAKVTAALDLALKATANKQTLQRLKALKK